MLSMLFLQGYNWQVTSSLFSLKKGNFLYIVPFVVVTVINVFTVSLLLFVTNNNYIYIYVYSKIKERKKKMYFSKN